MHEQTIEFFDKHNILYKFQSGFRKNHSNDFCLSYLTSKTEADIGLLQHLRWRAPSWVLQHP